MPKHSITTPIINIIHAGGSSVTCLNDITEINDKTAPTDNPMLVEKIRPVLLSSLLVNRTTKALMRINDVNTTEAINQGSVSSFFARELYMAKEKRQKNMPTATRTDKAMINAFLRISFLFISFLMAMSSSSVTSSSMVL